MRFKRAIGGVVEFTTEVLDRFTKYRQVDGEREAGGIMLGRLTCDARDIVVDRVTEPNRLDRRHRHWFFRSRKPAQAEVVSAWNESLGSGNYLGEWHTHPQDSPEPSMVDRCNWRRILKKAVFEQHFLLFVIVGASVVGVWEGDKNTSNIDRLTQVS